MSSEEENKVVTEAVVADAAAEVSDAPQADEAGVQEGENKVGEGKKSKKDKKGKKGNKKDKKGKKGRKGKKGKKGKKNKKGKK